MWPEEYIHVARQGAGAFSFTPRPFPQRQQWGKPLTRARVEVLPLLTAR